ncbi:MAG: hypothetical protein Q4C87_12345 [Actinomycetaceae bacterium]|nr:hypothetical protein [Actinomycetaceae bacterium]
MSSPNSSGQQPPHYIYEGGAHFSSSQPQWMPEQQYFQSVQGNYNPEVESLRSNATIVLILGAASFFTVGPLIALPAWIWGSSILERGAELGIPEDLLSNAKWGKILGIVNCVLSLIGLIITILFVIMSLMFLARFFDSLAPSIPAS